MKSEASPARLSSPTLLSAERRRQILELVRAEGVVRVDDLSRRFGVSRVTVRADLAQLAQRGWLLRDRGGAVLPAATNLGLAFDQRAKLHHDGKQRIGRAAASLIEPGDAVILDAGTTVFELARSFPAVSPLTVVTNAWNIAAQIGSLPGVRVMLVGGAFCHETVSASGPWTEHLLNDLVVDKVFLGAHALDPNRGVVDLGVEVARLKAAMIRAARQVILLADASKWGRHAFARVADWTAVDVLITDAVPPADAADSLRNAHVEITLA